MAKVDVDRHRGFDPGRNTMKPFEDASNEKSHTGDKPPVTEHDLQELARLQLALAQALTASQTRQGANASGSETFKPSPSSAVDSLMEMGIERNEVHRAYETLIRKRTSQTRSLLPLTARALAASYREVFRTFAETQHFNDHTAILNDAIHFARWLSTENRSPNWIGELARWESLKMAVLPTQLGLRFLPVRYDWRTWAVRASVDTPPNRRRGLWCAVRLYAWVKVFRVF